MDKNLSGDVPCGTTVDNQTRITLRNIKIVKALSEETPCYTATVYFDGKRVGTVSNRGFGGCDDEHVTDQQGWQEMFAFIGTLPDEVSKFGDKEISLKADLELICHILVGKHEDLQHFKSQLRGRVAFFEGDWTGKFRYYPVKGRGKDRLIALVREKHPRATILNLLPDHELARLGGAA